MRITKLSLTNFKSFKETQTIEFAPVTLLFGPNSVGKSSVLMALAYIQQILSKGHCNPQRFDAMGQKNIGGFESLVHGQDLTKPIRIRLDYETTRSLFLNYEHRVDEMVNHIPDARYLLMDDFGGNLKSGAVEFEIVWSERFDRAYVKNYRTWVNEVYLGCVYSSEDLSNTMIKELNTEHPSLIPYNNDDWQEYQYGEVESREGLDDDEPRTEFELELNALNSNPPNIGEFIDSEFSSRVGHIGLQCRSGAIPILGSPVITNLSGQDFDDLDKHLHFLVIQSILSQAFVLPLDKLLEYLQESAHIGPLRLVPDSDYVSNPHPEQKDWADGSAAWDLLSKDPNTNPDIKKLIHNTSDCFSSSRKLNSGYEILNYSIMDRFFISPDETNKSLLSNRHLSFKEIRTNIVLSANQLGTGISQVLPIVVAANYDPVSLISIEQPELHIHPRFQVELADVFLDTANEHSFLIETHSEHLILRLLKRIRQSTDEELPEGHKPVSKDDVSIVYLAPSKEGVVAKRIRIDEDGEFIDRWPRGFFSERRGELL
ncbi:AAA family ATPase [Paraglaciecola sp.]|uniref:AAA family ATPase n=1 Tax=Paraglaciecola sp. TaxID=1920173 RepID=UPI003266829B